MLARMFNPTKTEQTVGFGVGGLAVWYLISHDLLQSVAASMVSAGLAWMAISTMRQHPIVIDFDFATAVVVSNRMGL